LPHRGQPVVSGSSSTILSAPHLPQPTTEYIRVQSLFVVEVELSGVRSECSVLLVALQRTGVPTPLGMFSFESGVG
jgi:hypothetical protein